MAPPNRGLLAGLGGAVAAAGGWAAAQRADRKAIAEDPRRGPLFADFAGNRQTVRSHDGTGLSVRVFGPDDAPTVIFVHGWTCSAEFWKLQVEALRGERRVIAFDLRGHGDSERAITDDYSIEIFASDLDDVIEACVPQGERALLVGHSLGAMTTVAWAGMHPERVDERISSAVLVNTGVGDLISESLVVEGLPDMLARVQRVAGEGILRARAPIPALSTPISHRVIGHAVVGPGASPAETAFCERLVLACPPDVRGACGGTISRLDLNEALSRLTVPTLVISGELDRLTPPKHAEQMAAALPNVLDVVEVPRSGHMSPIEFPDQVSEPIIELSTPPKRGLARLQRAPFR